MVERYGATLPGIGDVGGENYQSNSNSNSGASSIKINGGSSSSSSSPSHPLPHEKTWAWKSYHRTLSFFTLRKVIDEIGEGRWWDGGSAMTATGFGPAARLCWLADKLKVD